MNAGPGLAPDAALALGIASTAMPFAGSREAEAERWLRILRLHGEAGVALTALGVSEGRLEEREEVPADGRADLLNGDDRDAVAIVTEHASRIARQRGAANVGTTDVLVAVMHLYGDDFDRVLRAHGTDRDEVAERLGIQGFLHRP